MRTSFSGIYIALRALQAQQVSLDVTGHNVANANNPDYSRQVALHMATKPYPAPTMGYAPTKGQLGSGVEVSQIVRMRDAFVDLRLRQQLHGRNYWETLEDGLRQVELFFNEPSENSISNALDQLWDSLQDLSRDPELQAVREVVVQRAQVLVESIRGTREQLQRLSENFNNNVVIKVDEINVLAERLARLNTEIGKVTATGSTPNDLLDTRDAILEELSKLVDIDVTQDYGNMVNVTIGGASLVHRGTAYALTVMTSEKDGYAGYEINRVVWAATGSEARITSGELGGMMAIRDQINGTADIKGISQALDEWTMEFVNAFNDQHALGFDLYGNGGVGPAPFFTFNAKVPDDPDELFHAARYIEVNAAIVEDVNLIRASSVGTAKGNGENARRLAGLRSGIISDQYNALISTLGVQTQEAIRMTENQVVLESHLRNLKESVSGVNLDEEMANMIRFQHAYSAAARMMTAVDEALDIIINRLGVVGR
jgi:flagellar hook-associated protein 1 FlgK